MLYQGLQKGLNFEGRKDTLALVFLLRGRGGSPLSFPRIDATAVHSHSVISVNWYQVKSVLFYLCYEVLRSVVFVG